MIAATLNVMATSSVTIHILDNEVWESDMYLTESTEGTITAEVEPGNSIALYAVYNSKKCEQLRLETLGELPIGFKIQATTATMTVTDASGAPLYMKNLADGTITELAKDAVINITIASDKVNTWVEDMYQLCAAPTPEDAYTRDVTPEQWGTICYPAAITEVQGGVLYELTGKTETQVYAKEVDLSGDNTTVAGQPYVFKANDDATQLVMPYTAGTEAMNPVAATGLVGTFYGLEGVPAGAYGILNNVVVEIAEGNPLLANRAYIDLENLPDANIVSVPGRAIFMIQNATTGLDGAAINGMKNGKYIMNGRFMIVKDGKTTNVLGL